MSPGVALALDLAQEVSKSSKSAGQHKQADINMLVIEILMMITSLWTKGDSIDQ